MTQDTAADKNRRRIEKLAIVRGLYKKAYSKQDIINLFRFIDWVMFLPENQEKLFWKDLELYEKEEEMPYITSVERIGYEKGEKFGYVKGEKSGRKTTGAFVAAKLISKKYGSDIEYELTYLAGLDADDLVELCELILDLESLNEVHDWIDERVGSRRTSNN